MKIKHVKILSGLVFILLCSALSILFFIYDRIQQREKRQLAQRALSVEIMERSAAEFIKGEQLYKRNCTRCHRRPKQKHFSLDRIFERSSTEFVSKYITKEDSLYKVADPHTIAINDAYGGEDYLHTFSLDQKEIDQLIEYLTRSMQHKRTKQTSYE